MHILSVDGLAKQWSDRLLFADVTFGLESRDRVGIIGRNGSGKSTLLKIIAGIEPPDAGSVVRTGGLRVGYLAQNPQLDASKTVIAQLFAGDAPVTKLLLAYEQLSLALEAAPADQALQEQLAALAPLLDAVGAWEAEALAQAVLSRLGVGNLLERLVGELSGGQRRRVAMAAALIDRPDLLILDEPTNHVDTETIAWLEAELGRWPGALLLVTHDRYFLDRVVTRMIEIEGGRAAFFTGGYGSYLEQKAAQAVRAEAAEQSRQNLMRRELAWLRRGARARSTKQKAHVERARSLLEQQGPQAQREVDIATVAGRRLGTKVLKFEGVTKSYGGQQLIAPWSYVIEPGDRIGIIGPNGSGKTTLLNMIAGRLTPDAGTLDVGETVHIGYYDQESAGLKEEQRVIDYIKEEGAPIVSTADGSAISASQMLERFLFSGPDQYTPIGRLSGGERRRLYLLRTLMQAPNLLLLDEPTNDLDIATLSVLEDYLDDFPGTLILVSHDRYFLDRTVERLLVFASDGQIVEYPGGYSDWIAAQGAQRAAQRGTEPGKQAGKQIASPPVAAAAPPPVERPRKLNTKEQRELADLERRIEVLEGNKASVYGQLAAGGDYQAVERLSTRLAELEQAIEAAMERWIELSERA